jgi:hypothetical protein
LIIKDIAFITDVSGWLTNNDVAVLFFPKLEEERP